MPHAAVYYSVNSCSSITAPITVVCYTGIQPQENIRCKVLLALIATPLVISLCNTTNLFAFQLLNVVIHVGNFTIDAMYVLYQFVSRVPDLVFKSVVNWQCRRYCFHLWFVCWRRNLLALRIDSHQFTTQWTTTLEDSTKPTFMSLQTFFTYRLTKMNHALVTFVHFVTVKGP